MEIRPPHHIFPIISSKSHPRLSHHNSYCVITYPTLLLLYYQLPLYSKTPLPIMYKGGGGRNMCLKKFFIKFLFMITSHLCIKRYIKVVPILRVFCLKLHHTSECTTVLSEFRFIIFLTFLCELSEGHRCCERGLITPPR